ncbi:MAG: beta-glucuronidase [Chloroflexi bacterium]|nr:beta-glucuronidase [Chloroflexota bacterium]
MLFPQQNPYRQFIDLSGYWDFRIDPHARGEEQGWRLGFEGEPIATPGSWNEQILGLRDYLGPVWYQTRFFRPKSFGEECQIFLRFGSVDYLADAWLNGVYLGSHEGGHLPFEFEVTNHVRWGENLLVVRVDGALARDRVPPGLVDDPDHNHQVGVHPPTTYDFFPYRGIQRPVLLCANPRRGIQDITVRTDIEGKAGVIHVEVLALKDGDRDIDEVRMMLFGHGAKVIVRSHPHHGRSHATLRLNQAAFWSPTTPQLYDLCIELVHDGRVFDSYTLPIGIRTIHVDGDRLLLNGQPILLRGFGRHEDFPVFGRGAARPVAIRDFELMRWVGANSFRTSHYPYDEETLTLADRLGFLVIAETPAVGLFFTEDGLARRLALCKQFISELIARDKNHPSVIMWSVANEPRSALPAAAPFFRQLYNLAKSLDPTRPVTLASDRFTEEAAFEFMDVACINVYRGWYQESGELDAGRQAFARILDETHATFGKPIIVTEFGADAVPGHHAHPPEMFSEEYQAEFITEYIRVMAQRPFVAGQHVWNLCDFKTAQGVKRPMAINFKGVFTRDRRPKLAAHRLRSLWRGGS